MKWNQQIQITSFNRTIKLELVIPIMDTDRSAYRSEADRFLASFATFAVTIHWASSSQSRPLSLLMCVLLLHSKLLRR